MKFDLTNSTFKLSSQSQNLTIWGMIKIYFCFILFLFLFGLILWHINPCRLFNTKSSLYIYIKYIGFGWVEFYGISTLVGYLIPILFIHIYQIYRIWLGWVLWHINHCWLFNTKSSLYIHIKYIGFGWVMFYGTSTIVRYLMSNTLYTYILHIYDLVGLSFMAHQPL